jgi:hypothetical protein
MIRKNRKTGFSGRIMLPRGCRSVIASSGSGSAELDFEAALAEYPIDLHQ